MRVFVAVSLLGVASAGAPSAGASSIVPRPEQCAVSASFCAPPVAAARRSSSWRRIAPSSLVGFAPTCPSSNHDEGRSSLISPVRILPRRSQTRASAEKEAVTTTRPEKDGNDDDDDENGGGGVRRLSDAPPSKRDIIVSSSIDLPFSADVAFDAFADVPRQPTWSPWLRSVKYLDDLESAPICDISGVPLRETRWTMGYRGLRFSWNAVSTKLERPGRIDWESTSGLKNYGSVTFVEEGAAGIGDGEDEDGAGGTTTTTTKMTLAMKFRAPRVVASLLRRSDAIAAVMEEKMLKQTLRLFRDAVMVEDLGLGSDETQIIGVVEESQQTR